MRVKIKPMEKRNLTAGLEDYIETIYIAKMQNKAIKGVDLAKILNVSRPSVSEALSKLVARELIKYESYGIIELTNKGLCEAEKVYEKHNILKKFFEVILNISSKEATENACKIEHIISQNILDNINQLTLYLNKNPKVIENFHFNLTENNL